MNTNIDIVLCTHFPFADYVITRIISYKADILINYDFYSSENRLSIFWDKRTRGKNKKRTCFRYIFTILFRSLSILLKKNYIYIEENELFCKYGLIQVFFYYKIMVNIFIYVMYVCINRIVSILVSFRNHCALGWKLKIIGHPLKSMPLK